MRTALTLLLLTACGRVTDPGELTSATATGCGDFFVALVSPDRTRALTVQVDRKGSGIGVGTTAVAPQNATLRLETFARPIGAEHYCTDVPDGARPQTAAVKARGLTVTVPPEQTGGPYRLSLELTDVDLGGGSVVPSLTATNVNVGWFPG